MSKHKIIDGLLTIKFNLDKIDPAYTVKGRVGTWCDMVMIETPGNNWNDFMLVQDIGEENRSQGKRGPILGNGTIKRLKGQ